MPVEEICRKAGISQATYFNWKKKYAGMMPSEMRRLRELEIDARTQYRAEKVVATLDAVCSKIGYPKAIRVDQGSEFVSRDFDLWA